MSKGLYLVDTNVLIDAFRGDPVALAFFARVNKSQITVSIVTYLEFACGEARIGRNAKEARTLVDSFISFKIEPVSSAAGKLAAREAIRLGWGQDRLEDLLIAASAVQLDRVVVTRNISDFKPFSGCKVVTPENAT